MSKTFKLYRHQIFEDYVKLIEDFLEDKDDKTKKLCNYITDLDELRQNKVSKEKYFEALEILDEIEKEDGYERDENDLIYHEDIPFLVECEDSFVDFTLMDTLFDLSEINNIRYYKNNLLKDNSRFINRYRVIKIEEYNRLIRFLD